MWNLKYDTDELICEAKTDSPPWRTGLWLSSGRGEECKFLVQHFVLNLHVGLKQPLLFKNWSHFYSVSQLIFSGTTRLYRPHSLKFLFIFQSESKMLQVGSFDVFMSSKFQ